MSVAPPTLDDARELLDAGDPHGALRTLRGLANGLLAQETMPEISAFLRTLLRAIQALGADELAAVASAAATGPEDVPALFALGYQLIEHDVPVLAAVVLARAEVLDPGRPDVVEELVTALGDAGLHRAARNAIATHPELLDAGAVFPYLLAFHAMLCGDLETARDEIDALVERASTPTERFMAGSVVEMVARADAAAGVTPLHERDLRGWHLVVTGGLLLHTSPFGLEAGMNGRYAFVQDSDGLCAEGVRSVELLLRAWDAVPARVFHFLDRDSEAIAQAVADRLEADLVPWGLEHIDAPGLIVAYDLADAPVELLAPLREKRPGQVLWAHAACWVARHPIAADLVTFVYQFVRTPWESRLAVGLDGQDQMEAAGSNDPRERADGILAAEVDPDLVADKRALLALAAIRGPDAALPVARRPVALRRRFFGTSPVLSNRFV